MWIDVDKQHHSERDITTIVRGCAIDNIISIYEDFCKNHVPFEILHMHLLRKSNENSTLELFFEIFLTRAFEIKSRHQSESDEVEVDDNNYNDNSKKLNDIYYKKWFHTLEKEYINILKSTSSNMPFTNLFKEYVIRICNHVDEKEITLQNLAIMFRDND